MTSPGSSKRATQPGAVQASCKTQKNLTVVVEKTPAQARKRATRKLLNPEKAGLVKEVLSNEGYQQLTPLAMVARKNPGLLAVACI